MFQRLACLLSVCILFAGRAFCQTDSPNFRYVAFNFPGAFSTDATGINNGGEIVGFYETGQNCNTTLQCTRHGFKLVNKRFTSIDLGDSRFTMVLGVNDLGDIVGIFEQNAQTDHGFLLHHTGQLQIIDPPSPLFGFPHGVNNSLTVVAGNYSWKNGKFTRLDFTAPGTGETQELNGISNPGIIAGSLFRSDFWQGLLKAGGDLDIFNFGSDIHVNGINGRGDLVGTGQIGNGGWVAFHVERGEAANDQPERPLHRIIVMFPGSRGTVPSSINYNQAIVGTYGDANGIDHGFLAVH